jgi:hypothetical protein
MTLRSKVQYRNRRGPAIHDRRVAPLETGSSVLFGVIEEAPDEADEGAPQMMIYSKCQ